MDSVNQTLYIPLYGKALVSRSGLFLRDPSAEAIWEKEGFSLKGKARSRWLAYNMGMRSAVFDQWTSHMLEENPDSLVLHIGCGLDSRCQRVSAERAGWYDIDFPQVVQLRKQYFSQSDRYHMIGMDARDPAMFDRIPSGGKAVVVMEGLSMYLPRQALLDLLARIANHFASVQILMDCYTQFGAKASKYKNPINEVGVTTVYGLDDPLILADGTGLSFLAEHSLTPDDLIRQLKPWEQTIFRSLFAGSMAKKIYKLYEYEKPVG